MARQERAIRTRRTILEAAAAVFDERGYTSATIGEILERAGVTKGALYFHFGSKEELALGVFEEQLAISLPPQAGKLQELVDSGLVLALRLRTEPLVRASVGLALDQGALGLDRTPAFGMWIDQTTRTLAEAKAGGETAGRELLRGAAPVAVALPAAGPGAPGRRALPPHAAGRGRSGRAGPAGHLPGPCRAAARRGAAVAGGGRGGGGRVGPGPRTYRIGPGLRARRVGPGPDTRRVGPGLFHTGRVVHRV